MTHGRRARAFSLVEVLVVIGIIAILLAILLPVLSKVREMGRRTVCARNLQQSYSALQVYANANHSKLPQHPLAMGGDASFPYHLPRSTAEVLAPRGTRRDFLYCPSGDLTPTNALWDELGPDSRFCTTAYAWLIRRPPTAPPPLSPPKRYVASMKEPNAAALELAADLVYSFKGRFIGLDVNLSDAENDRANPNQTSHLRSGDKPAGGNILFLDGHVSWRPFEDMSIRNGTYNDWWF
ncbi:MAG TPA: prepilin-type N-terminal cleavage/methylation domain-containing protein [Tepidisphaeraceae bacterium]|nr:prepilin-type N-terminal cleavage/methylation domain-containing protein [Tepidisphaeraceae bacterium]